MGGWNRRDFFTWKEPENNKSATWSNSSNLGRERGGEKCTKWNVPGQIRVRVKIYVMLQVQMKFATFTLWVIQRNATPFPNDKDSHYCVHYLMSLANSDWQSSPLNIIEFNEMHSRMMALQRFLSLSLLSSGS